MLSDPLYTCSHRACIILLRSLLNSLREWWQPEGIAAIFNPEDTEQEAIHHENHTTPDKNGNLLRSGISYTGDLEGQRDSCKG